jgi:DNA-binding CsgD family transcriptional regulator
VGLLPPHEEAEVRLSLSSMTTRSTPARAEENRRALRLPGLPPSARGRHLAWLAYNLSMGVDVAPATAAAESALAEAAATADLETRVMAGVALACVDCTRGACTRALTRIEDLHRLARADDRALFAAVLAFHHAHTLALLGRLDDARAIVVGGVSHGRAERDALLLSAWAQFGGLLSLAAGQLSDARAEVGTVPAEEEPQSENFAGIVRMVALCQLGAHTGDTATQRAGCAAARRVGTESSPAVRRLANRLLAATEIRRGNPVNAVGLLTDDPLAPATPLVPNDLGYHVWVAGAARAAGAPELAERAAAAAESFERLNPDAPLLGGVAAHTRGVAAEDSGLLMEATRLLAKTQRPLLFAAAAEDSGRALAERGRVAPAIEHLNAAFDTYAAHDATADARRVGRLLRQHGAARRVGLERPRTGWASLTGSELKVVRIIAEGATNRSAAEQLYLSPHTVSSHLRSAFTKLGINSRMQLARVMQDAET